MIANIIYNYYFMLMTIDNPRDFMKGRRPYLFSDTTSNEEPTLPRDILDHKLETLTASDGQYPFEKFCLKLLEKEICPNLKPSTGPSAGGDGKTDLVTYPVSKELALRYFSLAPNLPTDERWAFAFSCKKDWRSKATDDVAKIAGLERKHDRVYFVSNQYIQKRQRDKLEEELTEEHGFEVDILDRAWIIEKVIENKREKLAIDYLAIDVGEQKKPIVGPNDYKRQLELKDLERDLNNPDEYFGNDPALIQDYMRAAELSRGLDEPRSRTDGLYLKARDLAQNWSDPKLILNSGYYHAWTTYWWFNDRKGAVRIYSELEHLLDSASDAEDCERFYNLLSFMRICELNNSLPPEIVKSKERLENLRIELDRNANDSRRPNNALHARTLLLMNELIDALYSDGDTEPIFKELKTCLNRAEGLGTYPATKFIESLTGVGDIIGHLPGYDELFEGILEIHERRLGETSKGKLLYKRAMQHRGIKEYDLALEKLGRARFLLQKEETLKQALHSMLACSDIYMAMGLPWAARSEALAVAHVSLKKSEGSYSYPLEGFLASKRMAWIEMKLGRIPAILAWRQMCAGIINEIDPKKYDLDSMYDEIHSMDHVLGCLLMNISDEDICKLRGLESTFVKIDLWLSSCVMLYRMGYIDKALDEIPREIVKDKTELDQLLKQLKEQPAASELPSEICMTSDEYSVISTTIFGVKYEIKVRNRFGTWAFAENLLGVIEAALALAQWEDLAFIVDEVKYIVDINTNGVNPPPVDMDHKPQTNTYEFYWKKDVAEWIYNVNRAEFVEYLKKIILVTIIHITIDPQDELVKEFDRWHKQETFSRALGTSPTILPLYDLLGDKLYDLEVWKRSSSS